MTSCKKLTNPNRSKDAQYAYLMPERFTLICLDIWLKYFPFLPDMTDEFMTKIQKELDEAFGKELRKREREKV